jgi:hypothetical protein
MATFPQAETVMVSVEDARAMERDEALIAVSVDGDVPPVRVSYWRKERGIVPPWLCSIDEREAARIYLASLPRSA